MGFLLLAISVLFHQSYIFWFLAFVVSGIYRRRFMAIFLSAFTIVLVYILFAIQSNQSISSFILHDVDAGLVQVIPNINNLKFTLINGFRTIFQVHGNMLILIKNWTVLSLIGIGGALLFFYGLGISLKKQLRRFASKIKQLASLANLINRAQNPFFIAFILQLGFAFYSVGNAEFMVMLPMLFILSFHDEIIPKLTHIRKMALGIWIYNTVFFIVPTFMGSFNDIGLTSKLLSTERSTKPFVFISTNAIAIQNQLEYEDAIQILNTNSKNNKTNVEVKISEGQFLIGQNPNEIRSVNKLMTDTSLEVYTDNTILFNQIPSGSRAALLIDPKLKNDLSNRTWQSVRQDSFSSPRRRLQLYKMVRSMCVSH